MELTGRAQSSMFDASITMLMWPSTRAHHLLGHRSLPRSARRDARSLPGAIQYTLVRFRATRSLALVVNPMADCPTRGYPVARLCMLGSTLSPSTLGGTWRAKRVVWDIEVLWPKRGEW
ncbi:hypothetical protein C8Q77DRAFT_498627 [Trametes polyzona]|nr:hypothetical protein C8Q77DRAFT_498627 [Trametes polyzona]